MGSKVSKNQRAGSRQAEPRVRVCPQGHLVIRAMVGVRGKFGWFCNTGTAGEIVLEPVCQGGP